MTLEPLDLWLDLPGTGPLLPLLLQALRERLGDQVVPLRWAITAAEMTPERCRRLRLEAVLLHSHG